MPELPEVQTVVTTLTPHVLHHTITHVQLNRQDILTPKNTNLPALLQNRTITHLTRRAKRIVFTLDNAQRFYIHLGMTGRLTTTPPTTPLQPHTHLILTLRAAPPPGGADIPVCHAEVSGGGTPPPEPRHKRGGATSVASPSTPVPISHLRFSDPRRFGGLFLLPQDPSTDDQQLGPEPLTLTPEDLYPRLHRTQRPLKSALLDQRLIAGLGNIYVDESLHAARLHPLTPSNKLTPAQTETLTRAIQQILTTAIQHRGSTLKDYRDANNESGAFQSQHQVYAREHKPCPTCQTPIQRIVLSGRSTHFCPKCQPKTLPRNTRVPPARTTPKRH